MTILYEKVGRRYKPVMTDDWYTDRRLVDMVRPGHMLVSVDDSCTHYMRGVDPEYAEVIAALQECREAMLSAMHKAAEFKPKATKLSDQHQKAWQKYQAAIPADERQALWAGSISDGLDAAIEVLRIRLIAQESRC